ncbi:DUF58 domain-containing protein [Paenibacillus guangzhouensis]|uniref:DUF58 domain-containing protein n=1 Tax=Paenibacillus guangzhouensis TaxID=1473112 RepID=UPI001266F05D|nr:DUF58 domain-containing protein [Paenibacillus guangzhouensis]
MRSIGKGIAALACWGAVFAIANYRDGAVEWFLFTVFSCIIGSGLLIQMLALRRVHVVRRMERTRLFAGESFTVTMEVSVNSWIPLFWLTLTERAMPTHGQAGIPPKPVFTHTHLCLPGFRSRITYAYRIHGLARGRYAFADMEVSTGDLFGFFTKKKQVKTKESILIYPARIGWPQALTGYAVPSTKEEQSMYRMGMESATLGTELREYVPGDPWKRIHWKSSAKQRNWQIRLPDRVGESYVCIILDTSSAKQQRFEMKIAWSVARLEQLLAVGTEISLVCPQGDERRTWQLKDVMTAELMQYFAEVQPKEQALLLTTVRHTAMREPRGAVFVIVSERMDQEAAEVAQWLYTQGHPLEWVWVMEHDQLNADEQRWFERMQRLGVTLYRIESKQGLLPTPRGGVEDVSA